MRLNVRYVALAAMVALAGCGDDDGVTPGNLTEAEAQALAGAIFQQSFASAYGGLSYQQSAQAPDGPALAPYSVEVENTVGCPLGGEVANTADIDVDVDDETGAGTVNFAVEQVHAACVVQGDEGPQFTLNGNPSVVFDFLMETDGESSFGFAGSMSGAVAWSTEDEEGSCSVAMEFTGEGSAGSFSFSNAGTVCGVEFSESVSVSAG